MIHRIIRVLWGDLEDVELKKFGFLALGFFFLIGSWWPLKTLKDGIFINMVGPYHLPAAKLVSVLLFFPLVLLYSKLVDHFSKEKLIYFFVGVYASLGLVLVYFLAHPTIGLANTQIDPSRLLGWIFYVFCESYISLMLALYWSFINDITTPESAQKGYGLIIFGTQLGGLVFSFIGSYLSNDIALYASHAPYIALMSIGLFLVFGSVVYLLEHCIGYKHLRGYERDVQQPHSTKELTLSFLDGLKLLLTHPYVMGIFILIFMQEFISTIMGFQLSLLVKLTYPDPGAVNKFLFDFALCVQVIACGFGLVGTSLFQRKLGIRTSLIAYPAFLGLFIVCYMVQPTLQTIFYVMLIAKALGFALNQPTKEVLYIPTSKSIKYKSKAWIDMFGLRFAKASGSALNWYIGPIVILTGSISLAIIGLWILCAGLIGTRFKRAVANKEIID